MLRMKWAVCPICGKAERLEITPKERFDDNVGKTGFACISIECNDCDLTVYDFDFNRSHQNYEKRLIRLAQKWNRIPRRCRHAG